MQPEGSGGAGLLFALIALIVTLASCAVGVAP